jgi:hypothetical protein
MNDKAPTEQPKPQVVWKAAVVGAVVGLMYTLIFPAFAYMVPDVNPLFMLDLYVIIFFPAALLLRLYGLRLSITSGPPHNSWQFLIAAMLVNSFIFGLLGVVLTRLVRRLQQRTRLPEQKDRW